MRYTRTNISLTDADAFVEKGFDALSDADKL